MIEDTNGSYRHILKYTGIFGGVQGLNVLIGLVRTKLVAILLGPSGMGLASLFNTTVGFVSQATNLGLPISAVRQMSELYDRGDQEAINHFVKVIRGWSLLTALVGMLVCVAIGPFLSQTTFAWGDHSLHFMLLSPAVGMMAITGGETAILKGMRKLGSIAIIQVLAVVAALAISVTMVLTLKQSLKLIPLRLRGAKGMLGEGMEMVRLGVAFTLAAVIGTASEMLIRSYLNVTGDLDILGLYNAGYMLTITYAGMVFSSMEQDYFPRLSAVCKDVEKTNETVNKQMEVSLLLLAPMLVALLTALPVLVPLLFSKEFQPVVAMAQVAVLAMYFKVLNMPIAYITLARSRSLSFLFLETTYFVVLVVGVMVGFRLWGIWGTGLAIVIAHMAELMTVGGYAYWQYDYRCTKTIACYAGVQIAIGVAAYAVSVLTEDWCYWIAEAALTMVSTAYSIYILRQKTHLWEALKKKLRI